MTIYPIHPVTLCDVRTYPLSARKSKVRARDLARPAARGASFAQILDSLPKLLAAQDLRDLASWIHAARKQKRAILWGIGGHVIKVGLAPVLLPEVFLKAVSVVRNLGVPLRSITPANFGFIQHFRPVMNVVRRPTAASNQQKSEGSRGFAITGHHELLLPLLAAALVAGWPAQGRRAKR